MTGVAERPRVDPRIARRWIDARREEGRRRLRVVSIASAVIVCIAVGLGLLYSPLFAVRHVRVTVSGAVPESQIVEMAGLAHRPLMMNLSTASVAARLDADPLLGAARVSRHWPSTVDVSVAVRSAFAVAKTAGPTGSTVWAEIDPTGRVIRDVSGRPIGLPLLQGLTTTPAPGKWIAGSIGPAVAPGTPPGGEVDMHAASDAPDVPRGTAAELALLAALPPILRSDVAWVGPASSSQLGSAGRVPAGLAMVVAPPRTASGTVTVDFGDGSLLSDKVSSLLTLLDQGNLSGVAVIDLTVPGRPATLTAPQ